MKQYCLLSFIFLLPMIGFAQSKSINQFYHTYKRGENVRNITLPGIVMKLGAGIAKKHVDDEGGKSAVKLLKKVKKLRLLVMEDQNLVSPRAYNNLIQGVKNDKFDELISVRSGGTNVNFFIRDNKDKIKKMLILVSEEDTFVMISAKTKLKYEQITELINQAINGELMEEEEEPTPDPAQA
jgi:hypothetical protein